MISPRWIGLANYQERLTGDEPSPKALRNRSVHTALYVPPHALTALGVPPLRHEIQRGTGGCSPRFLSRGNLPGSGARLPLDFESQPEQWFGKPWAALNVPTHPSLHRRSALDQTSYSHFLAQGAGWREVCLASGSAWRPARTHMMRSGSVAPATHVSIEASCRR